MHNPTRRMKRFERPSSSSQHHETNDTRFNVFVQDSSIYIRHRQPGAQPDTLRGAVLVALIVVTVVLYFVLWELERSSFVSVPKPSFTWTTVARSPSSGSSRTASTRYPPVSVHWRERPLSTSEEDPNQSGEHITVPLDKPGGRTTPIAWPPPVTRVPEEHDNEDTAKQLDDHANKDEIIQPDSACHGACRFLLPVRVGEQESKARIHFMQLWMLARRLNRTLVLPDVGQSRMSACSDWPFDAYYDTNGIAHGRDSSDFRLAIDLKGFAKWVNERPRPPNGFVVTMESVRQDRRNSLGAQGDSEDVSFVVGKAEVNPKILSCLESKLARLRSSLPESALSISFDSGPLKPPSVASARLVQLLSNGLSLDTHSDVDLMMEPGYEYTPQYANSSHLSLADVDVLILDYDLRHPLFPASASEHFNLHYAPVLYDLADDLVDSLGPFLGVHWRMETVPVQNLAWCAASLVSTLHALLQDEEGDVTAPQSVRHVWLATDYPRPLSAFMAGAVRRSPADEVDDPWTSSGVGSATAPEGYRQLRKSSTFKAPSLEHDDAIGILAEAFQPGGDLETWTLTDLAEQLRRYPFVQGKFEVNETLLGDSGVFGILDKLVIVQARAFISGTADCSKPSSFSKQVIEARQESLEAEREKGAIRNVVEYFGKW